jgi:hypothetical protein
MINKNNGVNSNTYILSEKTLLNHKISVVHNSDKISNDPTKYIHIKYIYCFVNGASVGKIKYVIPIFIINSTKKFRNVTINIEKIFAK